MDVRKVSVDHNLGLDISKIQADEGIALTWANIHPSENF